jgi:hypothetical protein
MVPLETLTPETFDAALKDCFYSGLREDSKSRSEINEHEANVLERASRRSAHLEGIISGLQCFIQQSNLTVREKIEKIFRVGFLAGWHAKEIVEGRQHNRREKEIA